MAGPGTWSGGGGGGGALGAGPGRVSEVAEAREVHGTMMRLSQWCGGRGTHFAPRWSEIHVFPLEIKVPTRPGLERLIGRSQGLQERRVWGAEPLPVRTVAKQEWGAEGRPRAAGASFPPGGLHLRASRRGGPYKFFVTRWVL